jgi:phytoene dehydrogenase-like protein
VAGSLALATAARLQCAGLSTIVLERHGQVGGCAGFFRRRGFAFDVGATTLVDFEPGGLGGELLDAIRLDAQLEQLPGYVAWMPEAGRTITLHRDARRWHQERACKLGDSPAHRRLFALLDELADVFWAASRRGLSLPIETLRDLARAASILPLRSWHLARYVDATLGDVIHAHGLGSNRELRSFFGMLVEDTVHATVDEAPLVNAALGITIRGAGLTRARGGMRGFWQRFVARYRLLGGVLRTATRVERVQGTFGAFEIGTSRGIVGARQVVAALPLEVTARIAPATVATRLRRFVERDATRRGGALVMFLGVPESEVANQWTHHQLMQDADAPLGNGNNMFISVSSPGDEDSAPLGHRAVMISTHCALEEWQGLVPEAYAETKAGMAARLLRFARRVYPRLGEHHGIAELGTPRTYEQYTGRLSVRSAARGSAPPARISTPCRTTSGCRDSSSPATAHGPASARSPLASPAATSRSAHSNRLSKEGERHGLQRRSRGSRRPSDAGHRARHTRGDGSRRVGMDRSPPNRYGPHGLLRPLRPLRDRHDGSEGRRAVSHARTRARPGEPCPRRVIAHATRCSTLR